MAETLMGLVMAALTIAFGVLCGAMAINMLFRRVLNWRLAKRSRTWPTAAGRVVATTTEQIGRMRWAPKITYEYAVNGSTITSNRLAFDHDKSCSAGEASKIAESFPVGRRVEVFYDPALPTESTLRAADRDASHELIFMCIVLLVPTVFCSSIGVIGIMQTWGQ